MHKGQDQVNIVEVYTCKSEWTECAREKQENGKSVSTLVLIDSPQ